MFLDLRQLTGGSVMQADICVIGAGAAGIAIARELADSGAKICLVESGGLEPDREVQALAAGSSIGLPDFPLEIARHRGFGGSTNLWAGACAPMSEIDFEARPWVPLSGWPFAKRDLDPFYVRAQSMFEIGPYAYGPTAWEGEGTKFLDFAPDTVETCLWQLSPRTNFGVIYREQLRQSRNVTVLLYATALEILTDDRSVVATGVRVAAPDGKEGRVEARIVVLAAGGIENPRLLLLSDRTAPGGLGNRHDVVGRYFMQHPHLQTASVRFMGGRQWLKSYKDFRKDSLWLRAGITLSASAQRQLQTENYSATLVDRFIRDTVSHVQSLGYVSIKRILLSLRKGRVPPQLGYHLRQVLGDLDGIAIGIAKRLLNQSGALYTKSAQIPNPDSRVTLDAATDRFGQRRACLDWRLTPFDKRTVLVAVEQIAREFRRLGVAKVIPDDWLVEDEHSWPASIHGGYHHMGATRISEDPRTGVVDADCRVHGMANLYIAGCSVFPTSGYANPTLTLVAMALRLADHLKTRLATPG